MSIQLKKKCVSFTHQGRIIFNSDLLMPENCEIVRTSLCECCQNENSLTLSFVNVSFIMLTN